MLELKNYFSITENSLGSSQNLVVRPKLLIDQDTYQSNAT